MFHKKNQTNEGRKIDFVKKDSSDWMKKSLNPNVFV